MIRFNVDASVLNEKMRGLGTALGDLRSAWHSVHDILIKYVKQHFRTQGVYAGVPWAPLNPSYAEWKRKHYGRKGILHLTERLYGSLTDKSHPEALSFSGPNFFEYGTRTPYARYHQKGTPKMPARVVLPQPTKEEGRRIVDAITAHVFERMRQGGRRGTRA